MLYPCIQIIICSYVKEWLGAVVSGGIVDTDDAGERFFLPPYRRPSLTQETPGSCNFACHAYGVVTMTKTFDKTLKSMKLSGSEDGKLLSLSSGVIFLFYKS